MHLATPAYPGFTFSVNIHEYRTAHVVRFSWKFVFIFTIENDFEPKNIFAEIDRYRLRSIFISPSNGRNQNIAFFTYRRNAMPIHKFRWWLLIKSFSPTINTSYNVWVVPRRFPPLPMPAQMPRPKFTIRCAMKCDKIYILLWHRKQYPSSLLSVNLVNLFPIFLSSFKKIIS